MPNDENVYRIITSRAPVVTGAEPTEPEWSDLQHRVEGLETDPRYLADLDDVDLSGIADGQVMLWDAAAGQMVPGSPGGTMERVSSGSGTDQVDVRWIHFRNGIATVSSGYDDIVYVQPEYGSSANTIPRGNHAHALPSRFVEPISPGGYMSGGTRSLASHNVTLPAGKSCRVEARIDMQVRGGDPGPCYYRLHLNIDGNTRTSGAGENGFWGVSGVPGHPPFSHSRTITGTGSAINVAASISYYDGGGFYTDAGDLVIDVSYDR